MKILCSVSKYGWILLTAMMMAMPLLAEVAAKDLAGVWSPWRLEGEKPVVQASECFVLKADGTWLLAVPGAQLPGGTFTVDAQKLVMTADEGKEQLSFDVISADKLRSEDDEIAVEVYRSTTDKKEIEKTLPGDWQIFTQGDDDQMTQGKHFLRFAANGGWEAIDLKTRQTIEEQSGTYLVDAAGFVILSNDRAEELVFRLNNGQLNGFAEMAEMVCIQTRKAPEEAKEAK